MSNGTIYCWNLADKQISILLGITYGVSLSLSRQCVATLTYLVAEWKLRWLTACLVHGYGSMQQKCWALCMCLCCFFISLNGDVCHISCWTLQLNKLFTITNCNSRRQKRKEGKREQCKVCVCVCIQVLQHYETTAWMSHVGCTICLSDLHPSELCF